MVQASPKTDIVDLSKKQELSVAVMNLISAEEHLNFTAMKTGKNEYAQVAGAIRDIRKKLMKKIVLNTEGEMWCISKHLLATTMRLIESSAKYMGNDDRTASDMLKKAFDTYSVFWLLQKIGGKGEKSDRTDVAKKARKKVR